jgi:hypothetical protein
MNNPGKHFALNREKHKKGEELNALPERTIPKELFHYLPTSYYNSKIIPPLNIKETLMLF